jgi:hypothetical protein
VTDANGVTSFVDAPAVWSNWNYWLQTESTITPSAANVKSNVLSKYWAHKVVIGVFGTPPRTQILVPANINALLSGRTLNVYLSTSLGAVIGTDVYDNTNGTYVTLTQAIPANAVVFVEFVGDPLTNDAPNWVNDLIP